jgi:hypothetical protein
MYSLKSALCKEGVKKIKGMLSIFFYVFQEFLLCTLKVSAAHMNRTTVDKHGTISIDRPQLSQIYHKTFMTLVKTLVRYGNYAFYVSVFPVLVIFRVYEYAPVIFYNKKNIIPL